MKRVFLLAVLVFAASSWAQSLGDVAREKREHAKQPAKVVTNEDLKSDTVETQTEVSGDLAQELDRMRTVLHRVCSDDSTDHGRNVGESDKKEIEEAAMPLRVRMARFEAIQKQYKDAMADIDRDVEARIQKTLPTGRPYTAEDAEQANLIRRDYESRKAVLLKKAAADLQGYKALQRQLESVAKECSEAAKTVPN